jgi:hypothetical protein
MKTLVKRNLSWVGVVTGHRRSALLELQPHAMFKTKE